MAGAGIVRARTCLAVSGTKVRSAEARQRDFIVPGTLFVVNFRDAPNKNATRFRRVEVRKVAIILVFLKES